MHTNILHVESIKIIMYNNKKYINMNIAKTITAWCSAEKPKEKERKNT